VEQYDEFEVLGSEGRGGCMLRILYVRGGKGRSLGWVCRGLNIFTKEQMFFVAWGRVFCESGTGEEIYRRMELTEHAPERVRLLGKLENSGEFKEAFPCPDKMPRCKPWWWSLILILFLCQNHAFASALRPVFFNLAAPINPAANTLAVPQKAARPIHPYLSNSTPATGFPISNPSAPNP